MLKRPARAHTKGFQMKITNWRTSGKPDWPDNFKGNHTNRFSNDILQMEKKCCLLKWSSFSLPCRGPEYPRTWRSCRCRRTCLCRFAKGPMWPNLFHRIVSTAWEINSIVNLITSLRHTTVLLSTNGLQFWLVEITLAQKSFPFYK